MGVDPGDGGATGGRRFDRRFVITVLRAAAVGLVVALLGLLVWDMVATGSGASFVSKIKQGKRPLAPAFAVPVLWDQHATWPAALRSRLDDDRLALSELRGFPVVLMATLATFFAGRGQTRVVLVVNVISTAADIVLDALWIFGRGGFPRWGVAGAAWATVVAQALGATIFAVLILRPSCRRAYATLSGWRFDPALFLRLLRYGLPSGLQYSLEILAFAIFMMIVGRIGTAPLAASGITFNLNMIVFMPMLGLGVAVSAVVGRYLGADQPDVAERATWSAFWMSLVYMTACGALYLLAPHALLFPYAAGADPAVFAEIERISVVLLRFVALYSLFDMMNVIFAAALMAAVVLALVAFRAVERTPSTARI